MVTKSPTRNRDREFAPNNPLLISAIGEMISRASMRCVRIQREERAVSAAYIAGCLMLLAPFGSDAAVQPSATPPLPSSPVATLIQQVDDTSTVDEQSAIALMKLKPLPSGAGGVVAIYFARHVFRIKNRNRARQRRPRRTGRNEQSRSSRAWRSIHGHRCYGAGSSRAMGISAARAQKRQSPEPICRGRPIFTNDAAQIEVRYGSLARRPDGQGSKNARWGAGRALQLRTLAGAVHIGTVDDAERSRSKLPQSSGMLSNFGPAAKSAIPALVTAMNDQELSVRQAAAFGLAKVDPTDGRSVPIFAGYPELWRSFPAGGHGHIRSWCDGYRRTGARFQSSSV
jgi:hypothetical protein